MNTTLQTSDFDPGPRRRVLKTFSDFLTNCISWHSCVLLLGILQFFSRPFPSASYFCLCLSSSSLLQQAKMPTRTSNNISDQADDCVNHKTLNVLSGAPGRARTSWNPTAPSLRVSFLYKIPRCQDPVPRRETQRRDLSRGRPPLKHVNRTLKTAAMLKKNATTASSDHEEEKPHWKETLREDIRVGGRRLRTSSSMICATSENENFVPRAEKVRPTSSRAMPRRHPIETQRSCSIWAEHRE